MSLWWIIFALALFVQNCVPEVTYTETIDVSYEIVGIFESDAHTQKRAFNESMSHAHLYERHLRPFIIEPSRTDSYSVWRELCKNNTIRPIVVFGPQNPISDGAIRDQCTLANIPHIQATWQPYNPDLEDNAEEVAPETDEENGEETKKAEAPLAFQKISINFYPDSDEITMAYAKLLKYYRWKNFAALYEDDYGLLRIQKLLAEHTDDYHVVVRRLDPLGDNHKIFKEVNEYQESRILLDCHIDRLDKYIKIAQHLNMTNHYQHYIILSLDTSLLADKLTPLAANITWLSLTEYDKLKDAQHYLAPRVGSWTLQGGSPAVVQFQVDSLITDDIANHLLEAIHLLEGEANNHKLQSPYSSVCEGEYWTYGAALQDAILKTQTTGVTGNIQFDSNGRRINYFLHVNEIYMSKRNVIGRWESANGDEMLVDRPDAEKLSQEQSMELVVISHSAKPYFSRKPPCTEENCDDSDDKYEGFCVDLIKAIFQQLQEEKFNYTHRFTEIVDHNNGKYDNKTKKWTGLIGHLLDKKADLAVGDLTITEERKKVVDFSVPIMTLGISILYVRDPEVVPPVFSFLNPYTVDVWLYVATAYCGVSMVLFICARISTADWENPQPCDKDPEELENIWNFKNCTWLAMGSIMCQGCDILPKGFGTRWICSMWWFFAVIVCQTYIAQLAAAMTSALENEPINSVDDLAQQSKIRYGALKGGSTFDFFKSAKDPTYETIYENMDANDAVMVSSNDEGEKRVINGNGKYAFFMESTTIEYKLKRNCNLKKVGSELDSKDYGIAMPANSPFRTHINRAILKLKEQSKLDKIKKIWWDEKDGAKACDVPVNTSDVEGDLEWENLVGAFYVLVMGMVFSLFITAGEFMNEIRNIVVREQVTHKEAFIKELKSSLNFFQLQKPVLRNPSRAPSIGPSEKSQQEETEAKLQKRADAIENFMDFEKQPQ